MTRIRYVIDDRYLRVVWFGVTRRKIALTDTESVRTGYDGWNESWSNTLCREGRWVTVRRKSGLFRNFVITPKDRDAFIRELKAKIPNLPF